MQTNKPKYMEDYQAGDILFTRNVSDFISSVISGALNVLDDTPFDPSHVVIVQDEYWGIEAAEKGVKWCRLHPIFNEEKYRYVLARPFLHNDVSSDIIRHALKYYGRPYDYTGLVLGFPLQLITKLTKFIKPLRKIPVPLHLPGSFVCSAFAAQVLKDTGHFKHVPLLSEWHISRITPAMLLRDFPWRYTYEYNPVSTVVSASVRGDLTPNPSRPDNPFSGSDEPTDADTPHASDERQGESRLDATAPAADDGGKPCAVHSELGTAEKAES